MTQEFDNPQRVAGPGELKTDPDFDGDAEWLEGQQDAAYDAAVEAGMFQEQGCLHVESLIDGSASVASLGEQLKSLMSDPPAENIFARAHRLNGDDAQREQRCNGYFSRMARNER